MGSYMEIFEARVMKLNIIQVRGDTSHIYALGGSFINLYKVNTCLFQTQKFVPSRFGLDMFHCTSFLVLIIMRC